MALAGSLALASAAACALIEPPQEAPDIPRRQAAAPQQNTAPPPGEAVLVLPRDDAPGRDLDGLPRFPGSVRTGYERDAGERLEVVRVRYLTREEPNAVRGFYRGVFASEEWRVANVEVESGGWVFLAVSGEREATVAIEPRGTGSGIGIELTEPLIEGGTDGGADAGAAGAAGKPTPSPAPQPAPAPDDDYEGDDGWEDAGEGLESDD